MKYLIAFLFLLLPIVCNSQPILPFDTLITYTNNTGSGNLGQFRYLKIPLENECHDTVRGSIWVNVASVVDAFDILNSDSSLVFSTPWIGISYPVPGSAPILGFAVIDIGGVHWESLPASSPWSAPSNSIARLDYVTTEECIILLCRPNPSYNTAYAVYSEFPEYSERDTTWIYESTYVCDSTFVRTDTSFINQFCDSILIEDYIFDVSIEPMIHDTIICEKSYYEIYPPDGFSVIIYNGVEYDNLSLFITSDIILNMIIVSPNGCFTTYTIDIKIDPFSIFIPNVFTPNNDGRNDYFTIHTKTQFKSQELYIFRIVTGKMDLFLYLLYK